LKFNRSNVQYLIWESVQSTLYLWFSAWIGDMLGSGGEEEGVVRLGTIYLFEAPVSPDYALVLSSGRIFLVHYHQMK
jgi:hypothetical protein